ncbi:MAG: hypothetical protein MO852_05980 [Candidatus Devosia euplotis]|nr:hypothetical protein [Candidatus Devosia euplotis]
MAGAGIVGQIAGAGVHHQSGQQIADTPSQTAPRQQRVECRATAIFKQREDPGSRRLGQLGQAVRKEHHMSGNHRMQKHARIEPLVHDQIADIVGIGFAGFAFANRRQCGVAAVAKQTSQTVAGQYAFGDEGLAQGIAHFLHQQ